MNQDVLSKLFKSHCCSFYGSHLWNFNSSGFDQICKSWNVAIRILLFSFFFRYTFDLNMYSFITNAYNVMMSKSPSDEQTAIVHTFKTLLSVRSGNASLGQFKLNEVYDMIHLSATNLIYYLYSYYSV